MISEFPIPNSDFHTQGGGGFLYGIQSGPLAITTGPDGNLWFTNFDITHQNLIGRISPNGGGVQFPFPQSHGSYGIASSPDGNLWFTGFSTTQFGLLGQIAFRH
ncbi:MAG: virginiamycin B lyase family protein [Ktedonobacteraceae bacterium]